MFAKPLYARTVYVRGKETGMKICIFIIFNPLKEDRPYANFKFFLFQNFFKKID